MITGDGSTVLWSVEALGQCSVSPVKPPFSCSEGDSFFFSGTAEEESRVWVAGLSGAEHGGVCPSRLYWLMARSEVSSNRLLLFLQAASWTTEEQQHFIIRAKNRQRQTYISTAEGPKHKLKASVQNVQVETVTLQKNICSYYTYCLAVILCSTVLLFLLNIIRLKLKCCTCRYHLTKKLSQYLIIDVTNQDKVAVVRENKLLKLLQLLGTENTLYSTTHRQHAEKETVGRYVWLQRCALFDLHFSTCCPSSWWEQAEWSPAGLPHRDAAGRLCCRSPAAAHTQIHKWILVSSTNIQ